MRICAVAFSSIKLEQAEKVKNIFWKCTFWGREGVKRSKEGLPPPPN